MPARDTWKKKAKSLRQEVQGLRQLARKQRQLITVARWLVQMVVFDRTKHTVDHAAYGAILDMSSEMVLSVSEFDKQYQELTNNSALSIFY